VVLLRVLALEAKTGRRQATDWFPRGEPVASILAVPTLLEQVDELLVANVAGGCENQSLADVRATVVRR
jgi:hypothetical protein